MSRNEEWLAYQRASFANWRRVGIGVAVGNLLLAPFNFAFSLRLLASGEVPVPQVRVLQGIYLYVVVFAVIFLALLLARRKTLHPERFDYLVLSLGVLNVILVASAIAAVNQMSHGSVLVFALGAFLTVVLVYERPRVLQVVVLVGAGGVVVAAGVFQQDAALAASAQVNALLIGVAAAVLYPLYDRSRFQSYVQRRELERLVAYKDTLFRALGHDLRTPLIEIRRVARQLEESAVPVEAQQTLGQDLDRVVHRFGLVFDNLMTIEPNPGGTAEANLRPSSVEDAFSRARDLIRPDCLEKRQRLLIDLDDDALIAADVQLVTAVLHNLLSNAVKFTPIGGTIRLFAEIEATTVVLCIDDSGVGISRAALERIDQGGSLPLSTGTAGEQGLGLGLGVVKSLVATVRGRLELKAREGVGTSVRVYLPRYLVKRESRL